MSDPYAFPDLSNTAFSTWPGGKVRSAVERFQDVVDIRDFDVDPTGNNSSAAGIALAVQQAQYQKLILGPGIYVWDDPDPFSITQPMQLLGSGRRALSIIGTTIKFVGSGTKAIRTFEKHPDDGPDAAISVQIRIASAFVHLEDLNILTNYDPATSTVYDPGDDWDVSLFVTGQSHNFTTNRCRNTGYPRKAGLMFDITQPQGGADQHTSISCWWKGGLYGVHVLGPIPKSPNTEPQPGDTRGAGGMSSSLWLNPVLQGFDHHSGVRYNDTIGGPMKWSGRIPTIYGRINDNTMVNPRFTSREPESYLLDWTSGFCMIKPHPERASGTNQDGSGVSNSNTFARITENARNVQIFGGDIGNMTRDWSSQPGVVFHQGVRRITNSALEPFYAPSIPRLQEYGAPTLHPRLRGSTGQLSGVTPYAIQSCRFTKTLGQVTVNLALGMSDIAGLSGNITIDQLPFARRVDVGAPQILADVSVGNVDTGADAAPIKATLNPGQSAITLYKQRDGATLQNLTAADLLNSSTIYVTITYPVDPDALPI